LKRILLFLVLILLTPQVSASRTGVEITKVAWGDLSNPVSIYPGDENVPLLIEIRNVDDQDLRPIRATLEFDDPFFFRYRQDSKVFYSKEPIDIVVGEIKSNKTALLRYNLDINGEAEPGTYRLNLKVTYLEDLIHVDNFPIYVTIGESSELVVKRILLDPENPVAGDTIAVKILFKNSGTKVLKDIKAKLDLESVTSYGEVEGSPFTPIASDSSAYIETLGSKEERNVVFSIISDGAAKPKPYSIKLTLSYRDASGNEREEEKTIGIPLHGKGGFEIQSLKVEPQIGVHRGIPRVERGGRIAVEFDVINTGTMTANFVTAHIAETNSFDAEEPSYYVGPIEPDDFATVKFDIHVEDAIGSHIIPVEISYIDSYNQEHKILKNIHIEVVNSDLPRGGRDPNGESIIVRFLKWLFGL